jgi:hypothetical protein
MFMIFLTKCSVFSKVLSQLRTITGSYKKVWFIVVYWRNPTLQWHAFVVVWTAKIRTYLIIKNMLTWPNYLSLLAKLNVKCKDAVPRHILTLLQVEVHHPVQHLLSLRHPHSPPHRARGRPSVQELPSHRRHPTHRCRSSHKLLNTRYSVSSLQRIWPRVSGLPEQAHIAHSWRWWVLLS